MNVTHSEEHKDTAGTGLAGCGVLNMLIVTVLLYCSSQPASQSASCKCRACVFCRLSYYKYSVGTFRHCAPKIQIPTNPRSLRVNRSRHVGRN